MMVSKNRMCEKSENGGEPPKRPDELSGKKIIFNFNFIIFSHV